MKNSTITTLLILVIAITIIFVPTLKAEDCSSLPALPSGTKMQKCNWEGLEVIWINDSKFPLYELGLYFSDGALSDSKEGVVGESETMFHLLTAGTKELSQAEILDQLEFYGTTIHSDVTHEQSTIKISGLTKDLPQVMKLFCHLWSSSTFPVKEVRQHKQRKRSELENLISMPSELANRAFRALSLKGTPYENPSSPTLESLNKITINSLTQKLSHFHSKVKKRLYLSGSQEVLAIRDILVNECGFNQKLNQEASFVRRETVSESALLDAPKIYLIPLANSNQAQIRIGRMLTPLEMKNSDLLSLTSNFLGGGFISLLMQELRVKHGLTYGVGSYAIPQHDYGRAGISTSTKNESLETALNLIANTLLEAGKGNFSDESLQNSIRYLAGNYLFGFEDPSLFLTQLIYYDHVERSYQELYRFPQTVASFSKEDVTNSIRSIFEWNRNTIVIVGSKALAKPLSKIGKVTIINHRTLL
ncbi:MAG: insulinase family protein [Oligoflexia bacterium]|nr:insulinase family protein [Oligoflexia bacterium]MBF0365273.1 insulinase family protein [Oligoflexia bacterium]